MENVEPFLPATFALPDDPVMKLNRYQLTDLQEVSSKFNAQPLQGRAGSASLPPIRQVMRSATPAAVYTPEHARMQEKLMVELNKEYPKAKVVREENFIDVSVHTEQELILFEIKSDLEPRTVIRQALGQILEYAYHPNRAQALPVRLVIVGRRPLAAVDSEYMRYLTTKFLLPLSYRVVEL